MRTRDGAEVDYIIEREDSLTPIEVKWTEHPATEHFRHLMFFLKEHPNRASHGYLICRCPWPMALEEQITALP